MGSLKACATEIFVAKTEFREFSVSKQRTGSQALAHYKVTVESLNLNDYLVGFLLKN